MRIEVLQAFGWTIGGKAVCFHPPGVPYPTAEDRIPQRYLTVPEDLPQEAAEWAIKEGAAQQVPDITRKEQIAENRAEKAEAKVVAVEEAEAAAKLDTQPAPAIKNKGGGN